MNELKRLDPNRLTPLDALKLIYDWKGRIEKHDGGSR